MLSVIILILKIIGIAIAAVLGLALFVVLLVLFVPVRYRVKAVKDDEIQAEGKVSWLFGIILFKIRYTGEKTKYAFRICGYKLFSDEPKKKKKRVKKKRKQPEMDLESMKEEKQLPDQSKEQPEVVVAEREVQTKKVSQPVEKAKVSKEEIPKVKKTVKPKKPKKKLSERIRGFFDKIKSIKRKIRDMLSSIKRILRKIGLVKDFLFNYKNRPGFRLVYKEIKNLLRYCKPTKLVARVHFGMEDPCYTGQILGAICAVYPEALTKVTLIPDFEHEVLEGNVDAKGRIRVVTVLRIILRVITNKEFKIVWNEWKRLKEEL